MFVLIASAENPATGKEFAQVYGDGKLKDLDRQKLTDLVSMAVQKMYTPRPVLGIVGDNVVAEFKTLEEADTYRNTVGNSYFDCIHAQVCATN